MMPSLVFTCTKAGEESFLITQGVARREAESVEFCVPDGHALWSRAEDDLLV